MARKPRVYNKSGIYHIILRGNNQQNIFYYRKDYEFFISRMNKYAKELKISIYAYCLMSNHVHILLGNASLSLSLFVQKLANSYVFFFNHKYERSGHLFQGRFKSECVDDNEYFKTVYRYILQNCEKSNIDKMEQYKWNSYSISNDNNFLDMKYVYEVFDGKNEYIKFISLKSTIKCMEYENKPIISDSKAVQIIKLTLHISHPYKLLKIPFDKQISGINILKKHGLTCNQINRLTGISKKIIKIA